MNKIPLKKTRFDIYAFSFLMLFASLLLVITNVFNRPNNDLVVNVYYEFNIIDTHELYINQSLVYRKDDYPRLLDDITVEITNGKVRIDEETSPLNYCSLQGWVEQSGTPIICAPNYFMVIIEERL
ncbi:MAG: NusG domain II-containing protein [Bacilli bacterium]|jgi:hypothetical protein|nr:NusG domain II-containing protein [Bacilli bacterium]MDD4006055.1 NusG domain II-containing protein [Bacilli bacterium]